ncbi:MAG: ATPase [Ignavibacteriae bacterium 37-53-5]|nr:MAG: ATPase [Ignavibacteriae bacterium 37-53-5]
MKRTVRMKRDLPYKSGQVWLALTDSGLLGKWFMENDFMPSIGREFTFRMAPQKGWDGITHCRVTELEPLQKVAYTYRGSASGEKTLACAGIHSETADKAAKGIFTELDTVLRFTLTPTCGGTTLSLEHSGFDGFKLIIISFVFGIGWKKQIKKLGALLERMDKEVPAARKEL